jgi:PAS domain S-box-containing protein
VSPAAHAPARAPTRSVEAPSLSQHDWYRLVDDLPAAVYTCDLEGRVTSYNRAAAALWGREAVIGQDLWCGSWRIFRPDGAPLPLDQCPMAVSIREQRPVRGEEILIERPDGTRRQVMPCPDLIRDQSGQVVGAVNMLVDVTERKRIEEALRESEGRFRAIFGQAAVGISLVDLDGHYIEVNDRLCQILRRPPEELLSITCPQLTHRDDWPRNKALMDELIAGVRREFVIEKRFLRGDGSYIWVNVAVTPLMDEFGRPQRLIVVVEDVGERRHFRDELERQVRERTIELERAHGRLRERERLASLGTLSAGLGHDLANLILPLRTRLDAIEDSPNRDLPAELSAIRRGLDYLQRLAAGLRLMAVDPAARADAHDQTDLTSWWLEAEGVLRAVLPRGTQLEAGIAAGLPPVAIGRAALMQAVFNLVQNAAEAVGPGPDGLVSVIAQAEPEIAGRPPHVRITVSDNGPGMSPEIASRCFEPYFSTKARAISTGMGLALVRSVALAAGGAVSCDSSLGQGASFTISVPVAPTQHAAPAAPLRAVLCLRDARARAMSTAVLDALGADIARDAESGAELLVTDDAALASVFIAGSPPRGRCAVVCAAPAASAHLPHRDRIFYCGPTPDTRTLRSCFESALRLTRAAP